MSRKNKEDKIGIFGKLKRKISDFFYDLTQPLYAKARAKRGDKVTHHHKARRSELIFYTCLLILPMIQFAIYYVWVNSNSLLMAFQKYDPIKGKYFLVGFDNIADQIKEFADGGLLRRATGGSLKAFVLNTLMMPLEIIFPFYIVKKLPGSGYFKVMLFLPHVLSGMVLSLLYKFFLNSVIPELGGLVGLDIPILLRDTTAFMSAWAYTAIFGFTNVLMYCGSMSSISSSVVEYARLDGCSFWQEFRHITFPIIFPTIVIYFINSSSGIFSNQMSLYTFFGGEVSHAVTVGYIIFARTYSGGLAVYPTQAATGMLCTIIVTPLVIIFRRMAKKKNSDVA